LLRPPRITFERVRLGAIIIGYALLMEYADPRPFSTTATARILYVLLLVEIFRQVWTYRLEVSHDTVERHEEYKASLNTLRKRVSADARFRIRRVTFILAGVYLMGMVVNAMTDRCTSAIQCVLIGPQLVLEAVPLILQIVFVIGISLMQLGAMFYAMVKVGFVKFIYPGTIPETFDDVWGQDTAKAKMLEQVELLETDTKIAEAGGYMPKGVLLWGPPGTGKTLLAKAVANASTKPLILVPPGAFAGTFVGTNFLKVHMLFRYVRKLAVRYSGVIVFIDEIDSLGHRGGEIEQATPEEHCTATVEPRQMIMTNAGQAGTLEAFLSGMDGMHEPRGLVNKILALLGFNPIPPPDYKYMMIGATNRVSAIDPALLRAGRFGRKIRVGRPDFDGRLRTYEGYLAKVSHGLSDDDVEWAARNHYKGTGAEIKDIVNEAVLADFRRGGDGVINLDDLTQAMLNVRFGEGDGTFENADNVWGVAVHEAGHAVAFHHLRRDRMNIWFASIEQRGQTGGMVAPSPKDDDWKQRASEMEAEIAVSLASRVAELLILTEMSNGHGGDGPHATRVAQNMVMQGHTFYVEDDGTPVGQLSFSADRAEEQFHELRESILRKVFADVWNLLVDRQDQITAVAEMLVEKHTVNGRDIHAKLDELETADA